MFLRMLLILLIVCFFSLQSGNAQQGDSTFEGDQNSVEYLLYLFKENKDIGIEHEFRRTMYRNRLPEQLATQFLQQKSNGSAGIFTDSIAFSNDQCHALVYTIPSKEEERFWQSYFTTLTTSGNHQSTILFDFYKLNDRSLDTAFADIIQQRLIERVETHIQYEPNAPLSGKKVDTQFREYHYHEVRKNGKIRRIDSLSKTGYRKYPFTSKRLVRPRELKKCTLEDLRLMRNEIYADYDYQFPVEKWQKYFSGKAWYEPKHDAVFDRMNLVEQVNVKRIIGYERENR